MCWAQLYIQLSYLSDLEILHDSSHPKTHAMTICSESDFFLENKILKKNDPKDETKPLWGQVERAGTA